MVLLVPIDYGKHGTDIQVTAQTGQVSLKKKRYDTETHTIV